MGETQPQQQLEQEIPALLALLLSGVTRGGLLAVCRGCGSSSAFPQLSVGFSWEF